MMKTVVSGVVLVCALVTTIATAQLRTSSGPTDPKAGGGQKAKPPVPSKDMTIPDVLVADQWTLTSANLRKKQISVCDFPAEAIGAAGTFGIIMKNDGLALHGVLVNGIPLAADVKISLDGKPATMDDLKQGMGVSVQFAKNSASLTKVDAKSKVEGKAAFRPPSLWTVKAADPKKNLVS